MTKQQSEKVQSCPESDSESRSVVSNSCNPMDYTPGQNTRVGSLSLLQGIFPTEGSNLGLLHCRQILYHLSHQICHMKYLKDVYPKKTIFLICLKFRIIWTSSISRLLGMSWGIFSSFKDHFTGTQAFSFMLVPPQSLGIQHCE